MFSYRSDVTVSLFNYNVYDHQLMSHASRVPTIHTIKEENPP